MVLKVGESRNSKYLFNRDISMSDLPTSMHVLGQAGFRSSEALLCVAGDLI